VITEQEVLARFDYDRDRGCFISRRTGKKVGFLGRHGYLTVRIGASNHLAHRLVWLLENGSLPPIVDHADRNVLNNHISNLRASDKASNAQNCKVRTDNTSSEKGVSWNHIHRKWHAYVYANGQRAFSRMTRDFDEAVQIVRQARERLHGEFCCHGDAS